MGARSCSINKLENFRRTENRQTENSITEATLILCGSSGERANRSGPPKPAPATCLNIYLYLPLYRFVSNEPHYLYQDLQAQLWVLSISRTVGFKEAEMFSSISTHSQTWSPLDLHRVLFLITSKQ